MRAIRLEAGIDSRLDGQRGEHGYEEASAMSDTARILCFPLLIIGAVLVSRRWPRAMRRASRCLAVASGFALLCIIATGWLHRPASVAATHKWMSHGLMILDWNAIPLAVGEALARYSGRPLATAARVFGLLCFLFVVFLASITGYVGPSYGPIDAMNFHRFQVLHYWLFPALAVALVIWWYHSLAGPELAHSERKP